MGMPIGLLTSYKRSNLKSDEIPSHVMECFVTSEDRRFWRHHGVDPLATLRAVLINAKRRSVVQGGSTITQQLVKNLALLQTPRWRRKLPEALLAVLLEFRVEKSHILTSYLNTVYFGGRVYGLGEASKTYYKKRVTDLKLEEVAVLAALVRAPNFYLSQNGRRYLRDRAQRLLDRVLRIGPETRRVCPRLPVRPSGCRSVRRRRYLERAGLLVEARVAMRKGRIAIDERSVATLRLTARLKYQHQIQSRLGGLGLSSGGAAVIAVNVERRELLASATIPYARAFAFGGRIQPGSALKPFILVAALEKGYKLTDRFRSEETNLVFADGTRWHIRNHDGLYHGDIDLCQALALSDNTVFAQLSRELALEHIRDVLSRFGMQLGRLSPAVALGAIRDGLAPLDLLNAYATIASGGRHRHVQSVRGVVCRDGMYFSSVPSQESTATTCAVASAVKGALQEAAGYGPASLGIARLAAKTGTGPKDQVVCAFKDDIAALVWVGRTHGVHEVDKGLAPARILAKLAATVFTGGLG